MLRSAEVQYRAQVAIAATTAATLNRIWARTGQNGDWTLAGPQLVDAVQVGRAAAVSTALPYVADALDEQHITADPAGAVEPSRFLRTAPSGAPVEVVMAAPAVEARRLVQEGVPLVSAFERAGMLLTGIGLTMLADTRRSVYQADIGIRPRVGYIRMLNAPSCSRCAILAGQFYPWSAGFLRHPRCDCQHVPTSKAGSRDLLQTPLDYFEALSPEQQVRTFGRSEARAIREGADITRVVNIRQRGLSTARSRRARYQSMTVDDIYRIAGTRTNAIRLLREQGYIY